jgi:hypothetical protein
MTLLVTWLNLDAISEILDQANRPGWNDSMIMTNINNFEVSYEDIASYFRCPEKLGNIPVLYSV